MLAAGLSSASWAQVDTNQPIEEQLMRRGWKRPKKPNFPRPSWNKPKPPPKYDRPWNKPNRPPKFDRPWNKPEKPEDPRNIPGDQEKPNFFAISSIDAFGPGCPAGSVVTNISDDKEAFTVVFSDFLVELTGNEQRIDRQACRLRLNLEYDSGWEYSVLGVAVRGYAALDEGVRATQTISLGNRRGGFKETFVGPMYEDYVRSEEFDLKRLNWSGCRRRNNDLELNTSIGLRSRDSSATGLFTVDSIDGEAEQIFELIWRPCGKRQKKKSVVCSIDLDKRMGKLASLALGQNEKQARERAEEKARDRCRRFSKNKASCDKVKLKCRSKNFDF